MKSKIFPLKSTIFPFWSVINTMTSSKTSETQYCLSLSLGKSVKTYPLCTVMKSSRFLKWTIQWGTIMYDQNKNQDTQRLSHFMSRKKPVIHKRRALEAVFMEVRQRGKCISDMPQEWSKANLKWIHQWEDPELNQSGKNTNPETLEYSKSTLQWETRKRSSFPNPNEVRKSITLLTTTAETCSGTSATNRFPQDRTYSPTLTDKTRI